MPYRDILSNMLSRDDRACPNIPVITRAYEETFMRQPREGEKQCASGALCECMFIDPSAPFVCTEFILPGETSGPTPQLCILCLRKVTQKLFYDVMLTETGCPHGVIQRHGNLCGVDGEYAQECMLMCPANSHLQCMPLPVMSHQRNRYAVQVTSPPRSYTQMLCPVTS